MSNLDTLEAFNSHSDMLIKKLNSKKGRATLGQIYRLYKPLREVITNKRNDPNLDKGKIAEFANTMDQLNIKVIKYMYLQLFYSTRSY